jgi:hypothetical protein
MGGIWEYTLHLGRRSYNPCVFAEFREGFSVDDTKNKTQELRLVLIQQVCLTSAYTSFFTTEKHSFSEDYYYLTFY